MENQTTEKNERQMKRQGNRKSGIVIGWILIILGILFLLNNFYVLDFERFWPVVLIAIGIILLAKRSSRETGE